MSRGGLRHSNSLTRYKIHGYSLFCRNFRKSYSNFWKFVKSYTSIIWFLIKLSNETFVKIFSRPSINGPSNFWRTPSTKKSCIHYCRSNPSFIYLSLFHAWVILIVHFQLFLFTTDPLILIAALSTTLYILFSICISF